jgi:hypothetical protein
LNPRKLKDIIEAIINASGKSFTASGTLLKSNRSLIPDIKSIARV